MAVWMDECVFFIVVEMFFHDDILYCNQEMEREGKKTHNNF